METIQKTTTANQKTTVDKAGKLLVKLIKQIADFGKVKDGAPYVKLPSNFKGY